MTHTMGKLPDTAELDAILGAHVADGHDTTDKLLGAAFAVIDKHGLVYSGAAGRVDFDPGARAFAGDSFTWVASMTKLVTSACLMQLVERGAVGLDEDVHWRVPELAALQILRGFDADGAPVLEDSAEPVTLRQVCRARRLGWSRKGLSTPLSFAPGDGWLYGTALDWAGVVLEHVTGQGLGHYMQQHVFDPLGMNDTGFWPEKLTQTKPRTVAFSYRDPVTLTLSPMRPMLPAEHEMESGGSGLFTTAHDYARFLHGLLRGKLLIEAIMGETFIPQLNEKQSNMLEFACCDDGDQRAFTPDIPKGLRLNHGIGGLISMKTSWWIDRETGIAAVLVANVLDMADAVAMRLFDKLESAVYAQ